MKQGRGRQLLLASRQASVMRPSHLACSHPIRQVLAAALAVETALLWAISARAVTAALQGKEELAAAEVGIQHKHLSCKLVAVVGSCQSSCDGAGDMDREVGAAVQCCPLEAVVDQRQSCQEVRHKMWAVVDSAFLDSQRADVGSMESKRDVVEACAWGWVAPNVGSMDGHMVVGEVREYSLGSPSVLVSQLEYYFAREQSSQDTCPSLV